MHTNFHLKSHWRENNDSSISTEEYVRYMYENAGYMVHRLQSNIKRQETSEKQLPKFIRPYVNFSMGIPDFLVIDVARKKFFFVEVKLAGDGLNYNQVRWIREHIHLPVVVLYVYDDSHVYTDGFKQIIKERCREFTLDVELSCESITHNISDKT